MSEVRRREIENLFSKALDRDIRYRSLHGAGWRKRFKRLNEVGLKYLFYQVVSQVGFSFDVPMKTFWNKRVSLPVGDVDTQFWFFYGLLTEQEHNLAAYLIKNTDADEVFYDIGANYGFYSLLVFEFINSGEIHLFEPNKKVFNYLTRNISKDKKVILNNTALSDSEGKVNFFNLYSANASGMSTLVENVAEKRSIEYVLNQVDSSTLDNYIVEHKPPTLIKIDVEGAEQLVIKGGSVLFSKYCPVIAMEVWFGKNGANDPMPAVNLLYSYGYKSYRIDSEGLLDEFEISPEAVVGEFENFIFKKSVPKQSEGV